MTPHGRLRIALTWPNAAALAALSCLLQTLLPGNGVLAGYGILGSPVIVTAWLCLSAGAAVALRRHLGTLLAPAS